MARVLPEQDVAEKKLQRGRGQKGITYCFIE
jgi:hypothetical protein